MEDDLKKNYRRQPQKIKWKTNQSTQINLIGFDTIVNSPSYYNFLLTPIRAHASSVCARMTKILEPHQHERTFLAYVSVTLPSLCLISNKFEKNPIKALAISGNSEHFSFCQHQSFAKLS